MNAFFNRWLPAGTLALWGGIILFYWGNGELEALLAGEFRLYAVIAAFILLVAAAIVAFARTDASCCASAACSHALSRTKFGRLLTFAIILLPIGLHLVMESRASKPTLEALLAVQAKNRVASDSVENLPAALRAQQEKKRDARAADNAGPAENLIAPGPISPPPPLPLPGTEGDAAATGEQKHVAAAEQESFADYLQKTPEGYIVAEVLDLLYAAQDNVLRKDFEDKTVQLIVQYMPDAGATAGAVRFKGVRMFMSCCAADARPIATLIEADKLPEVPEMTWVKIIGKATFPIERGRRISIVKAEKVEKTEPPPENMLN